MFWDKEFLEEEKKKTPSLTSSISKTTKTTIPSPQECEKELEEVERELTERNRGTSPNRAGTAAAAAAAAAKPSSALAAAKDTLASAAASVVPAVVLEAFTLTFLAEWGDRSQVATIGLATTANVWGERSERGRGREERGFLIFSFFFCSFFFIRIFFVFFSRLTFPPLPSKNPPQ